MIQSKNLKYILASKSPRRQEILTACGLTFEVRTKDVDEVYPNTIAAQDVPEYLSKLKANAFMEDLASNEVLITADTIVLINNTILGKPKDAKEAKQMLQMLSGKDHEVITGVAIVHQNKIITFKETTIVSFDQLDETTIDFYIENYKPFDKAGSYGIQEYIGYVGIKSIRGSYFNVVGLPSQKLISELKTNHLL